MSGMKAWGKKAVLMLFALLLVALTACDSQSNIDLPEQDSDMVSEDASTQTDDLDLASEMPEAPDMGELSGKWYLNGDTAAEYFELTDSLYNRFTSDGYEYGEDVYSVSATSVPSVHGGASDVIQITFGEDMFAPTGNFSPGFELFTVSDFGDASFYVRESVIGTAEGDAVIARYTLITSAWRATDDSCTFAFYTGGAFSYITAADAEEGMTYDGSVAGSWTLEGDTLTISWADGSEDICDFTGNAFYIPSLDATVFNGIADTGVIGLWYGTYIGDLGEVFISETIFDNAVSVTISLDDNIGSMYGNSGMELTPDGSTAADNKFALHLDGDTLTVEPLDPYYEEYAGTFERP